MNVSKRMVRVARSKIIDLLREGFGRTTEELKAWCLSACPRETEKTVGKMNREELLFHYIRWVVYEALPSELTD